jgi:hypothetical protein
MSNLTNPLAIPESKRETISAIIEEIGPRLIANYPIDADGNPATGLNKDQTFQAFEQITRKFWSDQITSYEAKTAAEAARVASIASNASDPFQ